MSMTTHIGVHEEPVSEGKVLNRFIRRTEVGWEIEADMRHGELLVQQIGRSTSRKITTPWADGEKVAQDGVDLDEHLTDHGDITFFRSQGARIKVLSMDRPELMYAGKEVCREMAVPTVGGHKAIQRIIRFRVNRPELGRVRNPCRY